MDKREFCASFSVKVDTERVAFEVSPAPLYGGPEGLFRVRAARRWIGTEDAKARFFDKAGLAALVVDAALGALPAPSPAPFIPCPSRVSVRFWIDGMPYHQGGWTVTPPIQEYSGRWVVYVSMCGRSGFVPVEDITVQEGGRRG